MQIADFIRDNYSSFGVSVASSGRGNIVLDLPADMPAVSAMLEDLSNNFAAECDLSTVSGAPSLTVWYSDDSSISSSAITHRLRYAVVFCATAAVVGFVGVNLFQ